MALAANKYRLGVFFTLSTLVFVVLIIWLTGGFRDRNEETWVCYFAWSVQGLNEGSNVIYNGVPVGRIQSINIAPDGRLVEVLMGIRSDFRMDSTIVAMMQITGITGLQVINLSSDTSGAVKPPVYSFHVEYPVIPVAEGGFQAVSTMMTRVAEIIQELDVQGVTDEAETLLHNLNTILDSDRVNTMVESILRNSDSLDEVLATYNTLGINLNRLTLQVETMIPQLATDVDSLGKALSAMSIEMRILVQNLDEVIAAGTEALHSLSVFFDIMSNDPGQLILPATREGVWR
jgi:ABC-type transporter Mla subunit MlaD